LAKNPQFLALLPPEQHNISTVVEARDGRTW